jgi:hypothetical protein
MKLNRALEYDGAVSSKQIKELYEPEQTASAFIGRSKWVLSIARIYLCPGAEIFDRIPQSKELDMK